MYKVLCDSHLERRPWSSITDGVSVHSPVSCSDLPWVGHEVLPRSFVLLSRAVGGTECLRRTPQCAVVVALTRTVATEKKKGNLRAYKVLPLLFEPGGGQSLRAKTYDVVNATTVLPNLTGKRGVCVCVCVCVGGGGGEEHTMQTFL